MTRAHILAVDDDDAHLEIYRDLLEPDYRLSGASSVEEVHDCMQEHVFDLFIVDLLLPVINGDGLIRALREHPVYRHTPILVVSGHPELRHRVRPYDVTVMAKPFDVLAFRHTVDQALAYTTTPRELLSPALT